MNPSEEAQIKIQNKIQSESGLNFTQSDQDLADALNGLMVTNPETQQQVSKPYSMSEVLGIVSDTAATSIADSSAIGQIVDAVKSQSDERVQNWARIFHIKGTITDAEHTSIVNLTQETITDPDYEEELPWPELELGRLVDANDIFESRP